MKIILASRSKRRIELLKEIFKKFDVFPSNIKENLIRGESPERYVLRLAQEKAVSVASMMREEDGWVLGADTIVVLGDQILEKPWTIEEAREMITSLQGNVHEVITGFCIINIKMSTRISRTVKTKVKMRKVNGDEIEGYLRTGEPLDKAGGYAIQGAGGEFIDFIDGSFSNVVGLPLEEVREAFIQLGILKADASINKEEKQCLS